MQTTIVATAMTTVMWRLPLKTMSVIMFVVFTYGMTMKKGAIQLRGPCLSAIRTEKTTKVLSKPKEVNETSDSNSDSRGPRSEHLAWLKACRKGDLTACKKLLDLHPNLVDYVPPLHLNFSGVHIATLGKHYDLLRLLKNEGANFNAATRCGYTPLHLAAQNQDREMVRVLIEEYGVDTTIHDLLGYTYEYYADWLCYSEYDDVPHPLIYFDKIAYICETRLVSLDVVALWMQLLNCG
uniref:ANK_REP_REGION domain-containing protein n=1 Tax=Angiostrongylus cantonensis TaxID=6313 RepID=A0A158P5U6_ANGCA